MQMNLYCRRKLLFIGAIDAVCIICDSYKRWPTFRSLVDVSSLSLSLTFLSLFLSLCVLERNRDVYNLFVVFIISIWAVYISRDRINFVQKAVKNKFVFFPANGSSFEDQSMPLQVYQSMLLQV